MGTYVGHTSITVSDFDRSVDFYTNVMGLHMSVDFGLIPADFLTRQEGAMNRFCLLADDEGHQCVEIFEFSNVEQRRFEGKAQHQDFWSSHVCFLYDDIDAAYQRVVNAGTEIDIPLTEAEGWKFAYVYDPDGYLVELVAK